MIVTRGKLAKQQRSQQAAMTEHDELEEQQLLLQDPSQYGRILKDIDFARKLAQKTLEEMFVM